MPWFTGQSACGCCGEAPETLCDACNNGTPDRVQVTVTGITPIASCPDADIANDVYVLDRTDNDDCVYELCVQYPLDDEGFSLGPCFYAEESMTVTMYFFEQVGTGKTGIFVQFTTYEGSTDCTNNNVTLSGSTFEDVTTYDFPFDCNTMDTTLTFSGSFGFGIPFGQSSITVTVEAI